MTLTDLPLNPTPRTLRQFGGLWILFFGSLSVWQGLVAGHSTASLVLGGLAISIGPMGLIAPQTIRPVFVGWMLLVFPIGWVVSQTLLATVYYGVMTPIGLFFRLLGRDALNCKRQTKASYWQPKLAASTMGQYFRQY